MPIYEFRCRACGSVEEAIRPLGDTGEDLTCRACGRGPMVKVPSTFATAGAGKSIGSGSCGSGFS